ncbi:MAG: hypothetical protein KH354_02155 [Clostridiales bacterium]|nr:hypothetical protein [Clostridiales bacterium]
MKLEECMECYSALCGESEPQWTTFYEDTQDERSVFVPGWSFELLPEEGGLLRAGGSCKNGLSVLVQEEEPLALIDALETAALLKSLEREENGDFLLALIMGRLIGMGLEFDAKRMETGFWLRRDNLEAEWKTEERLLTVLQDGAQYSRAVLEKSDESALQRLAELAIKLSQPAMTSVAQDDLLSALTERYAELSPVTESHIDLYDQNLCIYRFFVPFGSKSDRLWIAVNNESASVGVNAAVMCDDIGLGTNAVSAYADAFINEKTVLITTYKNQEIFEAGEQGENEFLSAPESAKELEEKLAARGKGFSGRFRRGRVLDVLSFKGSFDMTVKI